MKHPWERGRPALDEAGTASLPACSLRASAAAPAAKTPRVEGRMPSTRAGGAQGRPCLYCPQAVMSVNRTNQSMIPVSPTISPAIPML